MLISKDIKKLGLDRNKRALIRDLLRSCLDIKNLMMRLSAIYFKITGKDHGHVHIHYRHKKDHVILLWSNGKLENILAKSPDCDKGDYREWEQSEFKNCNSYDILKNFYKYIKYIEIDHENFTRRWRSYLDFIIWLTANS